MREKYIEERFPRYFKFGGTSSLVDIASHNNDCIASVNEQQAEILIQDRDLLIDFIIKLSNSFEKANEKAFKQFWYEEN